MGIKKGVSIRLEDFRSVLPITTVALVLAAGYTGWIMYSRHSDAREAQEQLDAREAARDRKIVEEYGGDKVTILNFSASDAVVHTGHRVGLCYGVANAARVKIEPGVEPLKPELIYCTQAFPKKTTTFTLTAEDQAGQSVSASLTVRVE